MEKDFKKLIEGLRNIRLTGAEKTRMLEKVFSAPTASPYFIRSPYMRRMPAFAFALSLFLVISLSGAAYASGTSLPGDLLYPIKTKVVEPILDVVNRAPEKKVEWEEEKVIRRIEEAEKLAGKNELNDKRTEELEHSIEKSSKAFVKAVGKVDGEKAEDRKEEFRKKIDEREEVSGHEEQKNEQTEENKGKQKNQKEKVRKIKATATRALDEDNKENKD
ncbi:MAG: hypothetical protein Q8Q92_01780 [bacterium]|nr:hypothetical protein [bacterium]